MVKGLWLLQSLHIWAVQASLEKSKTGWSNQEMRFGWILILSFWQSLDRIRAYRNSQANEEGLDHNHIYTRRLNNIAVRGPPVLLTAVGTFANRSTWLAALLFIRASQVNKAVPLAITSNWILPHQPVTPVHMPTSSVPDYIILRKVKRGTLMIKDAGSTLRSEIDGILQLLFT